MRAVALLVLLVACVPDATPDPCGPCPDSCSPEGCVPVGLAELGGPIADLDVHDGRVFACADAPPSAQLVAIELDGTTTVRGDLVGCGEVHVSEALGYVYVAAADGHIARALFDVGVPRAVVADPGARAFDVCGDELYYVDAIERSVDAVPVVGGTPFAIDPALGPELGVVRCAASGRVAYTLPAAETVLTWAPGDAGPTVVLNLPGGRDVEPSLSSLAFTDAGLVVARGEALWLVDSTRPEPPARIHDGLVGPVHLRARGPWLAIADVGAGEVVAFDVSTHRAHVVARGLVEPSATLDEVAIYFGDATGSVSRVALPDR